MTAMTVTTRADGFGIWHARVTEHGVGNAALARALALASIVAELEQREGAAFDPAAVDVELVSRTSQRGELASEYVEVDPREIKRPAWAGMVPA